MSRPSLGRGVVPSVGMDRGVYCTWGFCNLTVNSGMCIGLVRGLSAALGGKTSSPYGKVWYGIVEFNVPLDTV